MRFKEWFYNEGSYTKEDIPKWFFAGISLNYNELINRQLKGIEGITTSWDIALSLGEWGIVLAMPGPATEQINKLSKILYDNPEYMASKNWDAASRVHDEHPSHIVKQIIYDTLKNLGRFDLGLQISKNFPETQKLHQFIKEFWKRLNNFIPPGEVNWDEFKDIIITVMNQKLDYDESEWRVKDKILKIPKGSMILYYTPFGHYQPHIEALSKHYKMVPFDSMSTPIALFSGQFLGGTEYELQRMVL
jgi:hypothetical protein